MAGTVIADRLEAASTSQLVIENGVALTPPTVADVNGVQVGTFCRAWVNFNGTGTIAIRASFNVSSITDNGIGLYTVNFTNAMPDINYSISALGSTTTSTYTIPVVNNNTPPTINGCTFGLGYQTTPADSTWANVSVFR